MTPANAFWHGQPPERQVATRSFPPGGVDVTTAQAMSRTGHFARSSISSLKIAAANFDVGGVNIGASATVTASIEYPQGTCTQIKFGGGATATIANNSYALSDYVNVSIPSGAKFWIRQFYQNANGTLAVSNHNDNANMGDALNRAASGLSDQTVSCDAVSNVSSANIYPPAAIISRTAQSSVCVIGDSIAFGQGDTYSNSSGDLGSIDRSIGPTYGYIDSSITGDTAQHFAGNPQPAVISLAAYCSHVIVEYGHNDIYVNSDSLGTLEGFLTTSYGLFTGGQIIGQTTLTPTTTSTDGWATTTNQTIVAGNTTRVSFNDALRAGTFGPTGGFLEMANPVETAQDSGIWKAGAGFPACNPWTGDATVAVHPNNCAYLQIQSAGTIVLPYLLNRDLDPASNDNGPVGLDKVA
jgi:hypothetical protein